MEKKKFLPHFRTFFQNLCVSPCGVWGVTNFGSGNSILKSRMHFLTLLLKICLWFFASRPELGSNYLIKIKNWREKFSPFFSRIFGHFFKNFVLGHVGCLKSVIFGRETQFWTPKCISPSLSVVLQNWIHLIPIA